MVFRRKGLMHLLFIVSFLFSEIIILSHQSNDNYTGVYLVPYSKNHLDNGSYPSRTSYTPQEVEVMLEVISNKFSSIIAHGAAAQTATYIPNVTYYESNSAVYIAEAAATLNHKKNKTISVMQEIQIDNVMFRETEIMLALECTEKANIIFPMTVKGIVISGTHLIDDSKWANLTVRTLHKLSQYRRDNEKLNGIKVGTRMICDNVPLNDTKDTTQLLHWNHFKNILSHSDFLICQFYAQPKDMIKGPEQAFIATVALIESFSRAIKLFNQIEFMAKVSWPSKGVESWETLDNMKVYWEAAIKWARNNHFKLWLYEAVDVPDDYRYGRRYGWWKLTDNAKSDQIEGYIEKIMEKKLSDTMTIGTVTIVSFTIGLVVISVLSICIIILIQRNKKLRVQLSNEDIHEFVHGLSEGDEDMLNDATNVDNNALKYPYDYSFEIDVAKLKIQKERILGSGEFGTVYQATIHNGENKLEVVALKISNTICSLVGLKGLLCEIKIMTYLGKHENIVELKGAYTAGLNKGVVYVATELCSLGSLQNYLRYQMQMPDFSHVYENSEVCRIYDKKKRTTKLQQMLRWAYEIANGMEYLGFKNVIHADLATRNVLLTIGKTAKICDFGFSRRMYNYSNYTKSEQGPLPWRWMAIETLKWGTYSCKSDIWSYGVLLWEICALGDMPFPELSWNADYVAKLIGGMRLHPPPDNIPKLYDVMVNCWHMEPDERPSFAVIKQFINDITCTI